MRTLIVIIGLLLVGAQAASAQSADRYRGGWRTDDSDPHTYEFSIRGERVRGIYCTLCSDATTLAFIDGTLGADGLTFVVTHVRPDGRTAYQDKAKKYGARGVCFDIDPERIKEATENVAKNNVGNLVRVVHADLFEQDLSGASVVTLYLLPSLNVKLMPKLMKELKPGTRIVSHAFDMGDWKPEKELDVEGRKVFFWTIPKR